MIITILFLGEGSLYNAFVQDVNKLSFLFIIVPMEKVVIHHPEGVSLVNFTMRYDLSSEIMTLLVFILLIN